MTETTDWPRYQVGPRDGIFALGVVSVNYARLEFAVQAVFTTLLGITSELSARLMFKLTPEVRDKMMREMLPMHDWPDNVLDLLLHFIEAHKTCYENRNKLMHSSLISGSEQAIVLYKTGRDGKTTLTNPSIPELRQVADDMMSYFNFGMHLSNMINLELLGIKAREGDAWYRAWPDKPPPPSPLEYTSDPIPMRGR